MTLGEHVLLALSKEIGTGDYTIDPEEEWTIDNALSVLIRDYPNFTKMIKNKTILDFGCGLGYQSAAIAIRGAKFVLGVDADSNAIEKAMNLVDSLNLQKNVLFSDRIPPDMKGQIFDIVMSHNSMEHFSNPSEIIYKMKSVLKPDGKMLITFGPLWFAPYGSHIFFFTKMPWVHILFSEKTIMNVRAHFRTDGAKRYEEIEGGLNKMTVTKFERIISRSELRVELSKYICIKGLNFLGRIPLLRELFVNHVSCILSK